MYRLKVSIAITGIFCVVGLAPMNAHAQMSYTETKYVIEKIEERSNSFKDKFKDDVNRTALTADTRDGIKQVVDRFEDTADQLKQGNMADPLVQDLLNEAAVIDTFLLQHSVTPRVQYEWSVIRSDLDRLSRR